MSCVPAGGAEDLTSGLEMSGLATDMLMSTEGTNDGARDTPAASTSQPLDQAGFQAALAGALARDDEGGASLLAVDSPGAEERKRQLDSSAQEEGGPSKKPAYYFEFAKKSWETQETFRLPDGTYWPQVGPDISGLICWQ